MSNEVLPSAQDMSLTYEERIDILFHELELAVKWDRPSILFAIYRSSAIRDEVNSLLEERLAGLSQKTRLIKTEKFDFIEEIALLPDLSQTVLLIDGFDWECGAEGVRVLTEFNKHREYFIDNNIRAIFWLYEEEVSEFAENATECWVLRHRVVEFVDGVQTAPTGESGCKCAESNSEVPTVVEEGAEEAPEKPRNTTDSRMADSNNASELLSEGILEWRKGDAVGALRYLHIAAEVADILADQFLKAQCHNALALVQAELGNIDEAVTAYQKAIALAPESGFLWNNLGQLLAKNERNEDAINAFKQALTCSPKDFLSWDGVGRIYLKMGLYQNAQAAFEKALEISPYYEFSLAGLAQVYMESGEAEKAEEPLRKAVEMNTKSLEAWKNLGQYYLQQERLEDALSVYQKAAELNPQNEKMWGELGRLYLQGQYYTESIPAFQKVLSINPTCVNAKINLAYAQTQLGDYDTAAAIYEETLPLIKDESTRAALWNQMGDTYMHLKEYEKAIAAYEQAGTHDEQQEEEPEEQEEDQGIENEEIPEAVHAIETNDVQEVEEQLPADERGEEMNESNSIFDLKNASEWNEIGNNQLRKGAYNEAILAYTKAIELAPNECWAYIKNLANVHYQKGKLKGKLTSGQADEPDIWEADDEEDTMPIFGLEDLPIPQRADENGGQEEVLQEGFRAAEVYSAPAATEEYSGSVEIESNPLMEQSEESLPTDTSEACFSVPQEMDGEALDPTIKPITHQTLDTKPRNSIDWNELGNAYARTKNYPEAIEAYKKAIEMNPNYGQPYSNLGTIYYHLGKFDVAILLFKKSTELLEKQDEKAESWNKLGDSYRRLGDYGNALIAYQKASETTAPVNPIMARARATLLENIVAG